MIINIDSTDRTSLINWESLKITDNINEKVNTCSFSLQVKEGQSYVPSVGDSVEITDTDTLFAGTIIKVNRKMISSLIEQYDIQCKDWTQEINRFLVSESFTNKTVSYIIEYLLTNYAPTFTDNNVACELEFSSLKFNNLTVSQCIQKLSEATNYFWYIDYDKDIHFFAKADELSSFNLTDTNENYIPQSLILTEDISQVRNIVKVQGGEVEGSSRTETHDGDGTKTTFPTYNKFSTVPTVTVGGSPKTVGVDYLDDEASYDCFWNFNEKYVRFKVAPVNGSNNIAITGIPLIPIIAQVQDDDSVAELGTYEYYIKDTTIRSTDEAKQRAGAELDAYANSLTEGSFRTYTDGLKSGQVINIQSDVRGIDEDYLIQSVRTSMLSPYKRQYDVTIASMRTLGIIYFLQNLLLTGRREEKTTENDVVYKYYIDWQQIQVTEDITLEELMQDYQDTEVTELIRKDPFVVQWVLSPYFPTSDSDPKRPMRLSISSYLS
ncbi:MAG: hypothetical protein BWY21_01898 [Parcubacteria group bacterium ADurb.Bin216]|nr:MAG: hypothetical protein BWY21_01898 [Parcubacteria group bacterium ADurb.Bin216]